jgi:DNA-binding LytR/AlgR family response regulator
MPKYTPLTGLCVPVDDELIVIFFHEIDYIQANNIYCKIYCTGELKPYITRVTLKEFFTLLPATLFCRVHDSYIVAARVIAKFNRHRTRVCIFDDLWLPVGRTYLPGLLKIFPSITG